MAAPHVVCQDLLTGAAEGSKWQGCMPGTAISETSDPTVARELWGPTVPRLCCQLPLVHPPPTVLPISSAAAAPAGKTPQIHLQQQSSPTQLQAHRTLSETPA